MTSATPPPSRNESFHHTFIGTWDWDRLFEVASALFARLGTPFCPPNRTGEKTWNRSEHRGSYLEIVTNETTTWQDGDRSAVLEKEESRIPGPAGSDAEFDRWTIRGLPGGVALIASQQGACGACDPVQVRIEGPEEAAHRVQEAWLATLRELGAVSAEDFQQIRDGIQFLMGF